MPIRICDTPMETLKFLLLQNLGEQVGGVVVRADEDEAHLFECNELTHFEVASLGTINWLFMLFF